jgi:hypothetical protein
VWNGGESDESEHSAANVSLPCTNDATQEAVRNGDASVFDPNPETTPRPFLIPDDETECRIRRALLKRSDLGPEWARSTFIGPPGSASERIYSDQPFGLCGVPLPYTHVWSEDLSIELPAGADDMLGFRRIERGFGSDREDVRTWWLSIQKQDVLSQRPASLGPGRQFRLSASNVATAWDSE